MDEIDGRIVNCMWNCEAVIDAKTNRLDVQVAPEKVYAGAHLFPALFVASQYAIAYLLKYCTFCREAGIKFFVKIMHITKLKASP